ncbi:MAG: aminotransferase class V-fold PLP-dependent enzyme [candidate division WOR-3 bacterium]|nr:aminotransferase class V-fold PLP-dependent enzyme [candidate division WOR-3 bacterium]MCX7836350.1 aminotransferase class V-fold PLP-dependent enzyme [candidate division WOR-3 bacterium]MDW8113545.1 aminotransferase class V-fold PLP-dependent enzyme [candidate division WOR-3 bacterium]
MLDFSFYRKEFPILENYIYLNSAASSPMPLRTKKAIESWLDKYLYEGNIEWEECEKLSEETREIIAKFLNANKEEICFKRNTSEGILTILSFIKFNKNDNIIVAKDNFPANFLPYKNFDKVEKRYISILKGDVLKQIKKVFNRKTKLIALDWIHFLSGYQIPLKEISDFCKNYDCFLLIDGIQGVGAIEIDLEKINIDFFVFGSGKWLFPPQGIGILYIKKEVLKNLKIDCVGWLGYEWKEFNKIFTKKKLKRSADKLEEGTKNYLGIVGLKENIKFISEIGIKNIQNYLLSLTNYLIEKLRDLNFQILERNKGSGIVACKRKDKDSEFLYQSILEKGFKISLREEYLRISPHFYNTKKEIDNLIETLAYLTK